MVRKIAKLTCIVLGVLLLILVIMASIHHIMLKSEESKIEKPDSLVEVDGLLMNVHSEGEPRDAEQPVIVLMSGSGVAAPVFEYKVLYAPLSERYRVAVVEKFGYGYSDVSGRSRDVASMVDECRTALAEAGEKPPYVLMPHSMSALEAIYWNFTYPEEISAIIGLDMAVPDSYTVSNMGNISLLRTSVFFGFHRFELFNPVSSRELTEAEYVQHKLLNYRNSLNTDVYNECKEVLNNAEKVQSMDISDTPILMFTTNLGGGSGWEAWVAAQDVFAGKMKNCTQIKFDCGHNVHQFKPQEMTEAISEFLENIPMNPFGK